jgi:hypothetical protein
MKHTAHRTAKWLAAAGAVAFLAGPAALPASARPCEGLCGGPAQKSGVVVQRVEVPVDDTGAEYTQMGLAGALGAMLAAGGAVALRRRAQRGTGAPTRRSPQGAAAG